MATPPGCLRHHDRLGFQPRIGTQPAGARCHEMTDAALLMARLDALAACSDSPDGITRLYLTGAHRRAVAVVRGWMETAGLSTRLDAAGTLIGARPAADARAPLLILGSHIDTVRNAGRYDGCLGVAAAIAVAERLRDTAMPYALEIRAFGDEEGVRFPVTLTGARAAAGTFDRAALGARDADGISLAEALHAWDLGVDDLASNRCKAEGAFAYLELHIEQGPVLEQRNAPLGIVTAIAGAARFEVSLHGEAGHAGTVPMRGRRDALVAADAMILETRALATGSDSIVATIGQIGVQPGAANVIPGGATFTVDLRAPDDALRQAAETTMRSGFERCALAEGVTVTITRTHDAPAVACDPQLQVVLANALETHGHAVHHLASGAGHDAMAIHALCPVGMLFMRCAGGISHHPAESVRPEDIDAALDVLATALTTLDPHSLSL